jgi:toxin FitB
VSFLLDTNTISEFQKPQPNPGVIAWMNAADEDDLFLSVATLAEIRYGIERMPMSARRTRYERWLQLDLPKRFEKRILSINAIVADAWGRIVSRSEAAGRPLSAVDGFLAATAEAYALTLITRNTRHFTVLKAVINPWT